MWSALVLYLRYAGVSLRSQMQYRASFLMLVLGHFLTTGAEFLAVWALFDRFGQLRGWSLGEVALFYGIVGMAFAVAEGIGRGFDTFSALIRGGEFDRVLLRPRSTALQIIGREVQLMRLGRFSQALLVTIWAARALNLGWTLAKVILLIVAVFGGACLFMGLFVLQATMCFWTTEALEIVNIVTYGGVETAQYPLIIYRDWFRHFFTYGVPLACFTYFPILAILDRPDPLGTSRVFQYLSPLVGVAFLVLCLQVWRVGVRYYRSTGS